MADIQQLIRYQRDCYLADNRNSGIRDLFHTKIRHLRFFDGEDVGLSATVDYVPLPNSYGESLQKDVFRYRRDKSLVFAALPIIGQHSELRQISPKLCAPLLYFPAEVVQRDEVFYLSPDRSNPHFNFSMLEALGQLLGMDEGQILDAIDQLPATPWDKVQVHSVASVLADLITCVDFHDLSEFPSLYAGKKVKELRDSVKSELRCIPATAVAMLANSPNTRGVLFELKEIAEQNQPSNPLATLFGHDSNGTPRVSRKRVVAPSILSKAQSKIATLSKCQPLTLVIGPPGTGKSHTIAAVALDHIARNQSVLICSRSDQAVDVVADKITRMAGDSAALIRAGRRHHRKELKESLENLLAGITLPEIGEETSADLLRSLHQLDREISRVEKLLQRNQQREIDWGQDATLKAEGWMTWAANLRQRFLDWRLGDFNGWRTVSHYMAALEHRGEICRDLIRELLVERRRRLLKRSRKDLLHLSQALRARSDGKQREQFNKVNFKPLLQAFPIWLCKLSDLASVLPLKQELFDLAILDEATQCDIASCLPLLQRAKRTAIVGDPKQLRHVSFLSDLKEQSLASEHNLSGTQQDRCHYRRNSILDLANFAVEQSQIAFLNEHFRSHPDVIRFSNAEIYQDKLKVMRQRPQETVDVVQVIEVSGKRSKTGANSAEAKYICDSIRKRVNEQKELPAELSESIGIISPFRHQADQLARKLGQEFTLEEQQKHDILAGTAHSFQGEERDVMYISLALDNASHSAAFRYLAQPDVLNVTITRARNRQFVIHSFGLDSAPTDGLLGSWLADLQRDKKSNAARKVPAVNDHFRDEVVDALAQRGIKTWVNYRVAGEQMDLIAGLEDRQIGIDLVGFPGELSAAYTLDRYRVLFRSGLCVYPLSYRDWSDSQDNCVQQVENTLKSEKRHEASI